MFWQGSEYASAWSTKQRRNQNPAKTSKMERYTKIVNGFQPLTIFAKNFILDVWQGSKIPLWPKKLQKM